MSEQPNDGTQLDQTERSDEEIETAEQADAVAKNAQYGQTGSRIDPGLGHVGGAGASGGIQPDISRQSQPTPGNASDLPSE